MHPASAAPDDLPDVLSPYADALLSGTTWHGDLLWFRHDDPVGKSLSLYGEWAHDELSALLPLLNPGDVVLDIGSYVGTHACSFAAAVGPTGQVWAVEPQPIVVDVLRRNAGSAAGRVEVVHAGVGAHDAEIQVAAPDVHDRGNFGAAALGGGAGGVDPTVPVVTVDSLAIERVRLMKIDVEGMEHDVLRGAARTLTTCRPIVYAECNSLRAGVPVLTLLQDEQYDVWLHRPAAYFGENFRGVAENVFGVAHESNLLALPTEMAAELFPLIAGRDDMVPVPDLDALAVGLLRTPRYGDESTFDRDPAVLLPRLREIERMLAERTQAWETRLEQLDADVSEVSQQRDEQQARADDEATRADAAEAARDDVRARLRRETAAREQHAARAAALEAQLAGLQTETAAVAARLAAVAARLAAVEASTAWRVTAPLRAAGTAKRAVASHPVGRVLRLLWLALTGRLRPELTRRRHLALLAGSGLFDEQLYLSENPDVPRGAALRHYLDHGDAEARRPNAIFDSEWYRDTNPDVASAGVNALVHYALSGAPEGRDPGPGFSTSYYLATNDDVRSAAVNPLAHYLRHGQQEGRPPRPPHDDDNGDETVASRPSAPSEQEWDAVPVREASEPRVVVIVPVYRGLEETLRCLYSVVTSPVSLSYRLLVIDDCSPEQELTLALAQLAGRGLFELLVNEHNMGFVGSVNRGMRLAEGQDVVLLNSDTEVYGNWLDRLSSVAWTEPRRGTVTPLTNSGTVASYPRFARDNAGLLEVAPGDLDALAADRLAGCVVDVPTCVGFCVYIRQDCLADVGLFDEEAFGRGYGEENDFSRRAAARGWQNVLTGDVFVRHYGSTSFRESAAPLIRNGLQVLNARYPGYNALVAAHIAADPAGPMRRELDLARLQRSRAGRPAFLLLTHALGGGTKRHVDELARALDEEGVLPLVLRPDADAGHVRLGSPVMADTPNLRYAWDDAPDAALLDVLRALDVRHLHIHHLQGYEAGAERVRALATALDVLFDVTLHDWMAVCPRIDMVDHSRRFCGGPGLDKCRSCITRNGSPFGRPDSAVWQARHLDLLLRARRVFAPSADTAARFERIWPALHVEVRPHAEQRLGLPVAASAPDDGQVVVAVLGAVGISKGSEVLLALAEDAHTRGLPVRYRVFGYTNADARFRHLPNVSMTGKYPPDLLPALVAESGCTLALFPGVWPETFSYTLSEAVDLGLHPVAFNIGAVADRMMRDGVGTVLPWPLVDDPAAVNDRLLEIRPAGAAPARAIARYEDLLTDYYDLEVQQRTRV